jgi:hypothetical protein
MTGGDHHMLYACLQNMRLLVSEGFIDSLGHLPVDLRKLVITHSVIKRTWISALFAPRLACLLVNWNGCYLENLHSFLPLAIGGSRFI